MNRDHVLFLEDILDSIAKIEDYTEGLTYEDFQEDEKTIDAVVRNFEIIGEAVNNIPESLKKRYPEVEWKEAVGFRNVMIHEYFGVDSEAVWETIERNLPALK
ncbi:MAG: DUF86 domain-containing protein, partial [Candidatus Bipolaricaulia bacterium]